MIAIPICGTPRTGGNYLCDLLRQRGIGCGDEWVSPRLRNPLMTAWMIPDYKYYMTLWRLRAVNDIMVIKIHWGEMAYAWVNRDIPSLFHPGSKFFWIFMTRDYHEQGKSWEHANRTQEWFGKSRSNKQYDMKRVEYFESESKIRTEAWMKYFKENGIEPYHIKFEDLLKHPAQIAGEIACLVEEMKNG